MLFYAEWSSSFFYTEWSSLDSISDENWLLRNLLYLIYQLRFLRGFPLSLSPFFLIFFLCQAALCRDKRSWITESNFPCLFNCKIVGRDFCKNFCNMLLKLFYSNKYPICSINLFENTKTWRNVKRNFSSFHPYSQDYYF